MRKLIEIDESEIVDAIASYIEYNYGIVLPDENEIQFITDYDENDERDHVIGAQVEVIELQEDNK